MNNSMNTSNYINIHSHTITVLRSTKSHNKKKTTAKTTLLILYFPKIGEPQYGPQYTIVLNIRIPKKVPLILGNPHIGTAYVCQDGMVASMCILQGKVVLLFQDMGFRV